MFGAAFAPKMSVTVAGRWSSPVNRGEKGDFVISTTATDHRAMIAKVQAGLNRNPWYLEKNERKDVSGRLAKVMHAALVRDIALAVKGNADGLKVSAARLMADLKKVGDVVLKYHLLHVKKQVNKGGKVFAQLTEEYTAHKRRKFGFVKPILKATNELLGGLRVRVDRL